MSREIQVDGPELAALTSQLQSATKSMSAILADLDQEVSALRSSWTGEAQRSYEIAQTEWTRCMTIMQTALQRFGEVVTETGTGFAETERANSNKWK
jgi:early secretory antigenic target protein ESAT-6